MMPTVGSILEESARRKLLYGTWRVEFVVGVTGTEKGGTPRQLESLRFLFSRLQPDALRHGDCVGVDSQSQDIFEEVCGTGPVYIHPPYNNSHRAFRKGVQHAPLDYLLRDRYVAGCISGFNTHLLVALPSTPFETLRSGTWATIRYARKAGTPRIILLP